jgi:hypothetical protein
MSPVDYTMGMYLRVGAYWYLKILAEISRSCVAGSSTIELLVYVDLRLRQPVRIHIWNCQSVN